MLNTLLATQIKSESKLIIPLSNTTEPKIAQSALAEELYKCCSSQTNQSPLPSSTFIPANHEIWRHKMPQANLDFSSFMIP